MLSHRLNFNIFRFSGAGIRDRIGIFTLFTQSKSVVERGLKEYLSHQMFANHTYVLSKTTLNLKLDYQNVPKNFSPASSSSDSCILFVQRFDNTPKNLFASKNLLQKISSNFNVFFALRRHYPGGI
jgi:hypothetical protein